MIVLCHNCTVGPMNVEVIPHYTPTRLGNWNVCQAGMMSCEWLLMKWFGK